MEDLRDNFLFHFVPFPLSKDQASTIKILINFSAELTFYQIFWFVIKFFHNLDRYWDYQNFVQHITYGQIVSWIFLIEKVRFEIWFVKLFS